MAMTCFEHDDALEDLSLICKSYLAVGEVGLREQKAVSPSCRWSTQGVTVYSESRVLDSFSRSLLFSLYDWSICDSTFICVLPDLNYGIVLSKVGEWVRLDIV